MSHRTLGAPAQVAGETPHSVSRATRIIFAAINPLAGTL